MNEAAELTIWASADATASARVESSLAQQVSASFVLLRDPLYRYLLVSTRSREKAEDLTQEVFLRLFRYVAAGNSVANVRLWAFTVAHNLAVNEHSGKHYEISFDLPEWNELLGSRRDGRPNPEQNLIQAERYESVRHAVNSLTDLERRVFYLRVDGLSYREIAGVLSVTTSTVSDAIYRGIGKLKAELNA
jgi:RNA polymerase sigma-70 factor (ECF subfamily)